MSDSAHAQEGKRLRSDPNFTSRCSRPWLVSFSVLSVMADPGTYANHLGSRCRVASWTMHRNRSDGGRKSSEQDRKRKRHRNREKGHWAREEKKWKVKIRIKKKKKTGRSSWNPACQLANAYARKAMIIPVTIAPGSNLGSSKKGLPECPL